MKFRSSYKTQSGETEDFIINKRVRQGDTLSTTLFNFALKYIDRKINKGTPRNRGQIRAYADDIAFETNNRTMEQILREIVSQEKIKILTIKQEKTK